MATEEITANLDKANKDASSANETLKENEAEIRFVGKKSVENVSTIRNPEAIGLLKQLCQKHSGKEFLFYYKDEQGEIRQVSSSQINNFLKKYHKNLIPKMFRTWNGNNVLLRHLISF